MGQFSIDGVGQFYIGGDNCEYDGIYWDESYSCSGCYFSLVQFPHQSDAQVEGVKSYLRSNRDVTGISVTKLEKLLNAKDILAAI